MNGSGPEGTKPEINPSSPDTAVRGIRRIGTVPPEIVAGLVSVAARDILERGSRNGQRLPAVGILRSGRGGGSSAGVQEGPMPESYHDEIPAI